MPSEATFLRSADGRSVRQRYCGFLDLPVAEFIQIQRHLLEEQIELVSGSPLAGRLPHWRKSVGVDDFRRSLPLAAYSDYSGFLNDGHDIFPETEVRWVHTSAPGGSFKRIPWTRRFEQVQARNVVAALILSSASAGYEVMARPQLKVMAILPDKPFASAYVASNLQEQFHAQIIPSSSGENSLPFRNKVDAALIQALSTDLDFVICMTSTLLRVSERAASMFGEGKLPIGVTQLHPRVSWRLLRSRLQGQRRLLPSSLWSPKGIVGWGVDSDVLGDKIALQWGKPLFQIYASSECGVIAMQEAPGSPMAFLPDSVFLEFLPFGAPTNDGRTVLMDELEDGKLYEPVITSFYGMPLFRYRQGDLVRVQKAKGNKVPRMYFYGRADDVIDVSGIARLNAETVARALNAIGVKDGRWCLHKEYEKGRPLLRLYLEMSDPGRAAELRHRFHRALMDADQHYREAVYTVAFNPVRLAVLPPDAVDRALKSDGSNESRLRMNPPDAVVQALRRAAQEMK